MTNTIDITSEFVINTLAEKAKKVVGWGSISLDMISDDMILKHFKLEKQSQAVKKIFIVGFKETVKKINYYSRVKLKVLQIDKQTYDRLEEYELVRVKRNLSIQKKREEVREKDYKENMAALDKMLNKVKTAMEFYDNWKLSSGKSLGDATKEDLIKEAELNKKSATGHMQNYKFYSKMAELVEGGKTVSESIDLTQAHKIRESVFLP